MDELNKNNLELELISYDAGGFIAANRNIFNNIDLSDNSKFIINQALKGTPMIKMGNGYPQVMMVAGVHGNELAPQIAALRLIDKLFHMELNGTLYIIPFASPKSTMDNSRYFDGIDLNRSSHLPNTVTNLILNKAMELNVSAIGDFHSSAPNSNPGKEGVFCTQNPCNASFYIADFISKKVGSEKIIYPVAGIPFKGALEDESNLKQIPSVTCEVLSAVGYSNEKICKRSYLQMIAFLEYFGIID
ncbi:succinylglutamate desuccinylase/aspartoacylase family protein [uncultured Methanobrevibacter sp.]|uniref:succinylglutamate desuccinylase/aspartoacylase domain-containing protein n=1 Tax=uncultured Methanobrevibacter sp. TaxID=253161 RepID=UPI0025F120F4|nr:succinylglutamate desuccinylase/aspartoacylase family protein [uncultured Methanobrevibacter sp.]